MHILYLCLDVTEMNLCLCQKAFFCILENSPLNEDTKFCKMHMLHSLLPTLPPWLSFLCPYLVVWGTLLAFKSISSMGINKVELNMSWSRYEDVKAVWHLFSHSEIKYNVLIPNASDRINRNDLRFPPWEFCTKPPLDTHTACSRTHKHPSLVQ